MNTLKNLREICERAKTGPTMQHFNTREVAALLDALEEARETVAYYSDTDTENDEPRLDWNGVNNPVYIQDKGKRARAALSRIDELLKELK